MNWQENDLKVVELREKIIELTSEFDKKNGTEIEEYNSKLHKFINYRLKKVSNSILSEHFFITINSLKIANSNI